ncbi:DUF6351 family protein [Comamonas composti]|uniref:DUF6351 family protein n=1 Tax=Comamonas composti TaxID=408558 RepID=UPI00041D4756|nr:DUF6351 family protein [Comamonas composti]
MKPFHLLAVSAACAALVAACGGSDSPSTTPTTPTEPPQVKLSALSSQPQYVSGGDVLVAVDAPEKDQAQLSFWLNGSQTTPERASATATRMQALVKGLKLGDNQLEVRHASHGKLAELKLTNHPITGPMFSGPQQEPFLCSVVSDLGKEPLVDTQDSKYFAVKSDGNVVGYSKNCSIDSYVEYYYLPAGKKSHGDYKPMPSDGSRPADMGTTTLTDGRTVDFIVRWERGTINRFIYQYVMLAPMGENPAKPDTSLWNGRLVYHFQGGVGFGHYQGGPDKRAGLVDALAKGYAVAYSTGNRTGEHYNLVLGGETAMMTKEGFIKRYGVPSYTVGLGASGGAIQQYVYPQNHPGLLDAAVAVQPYPDMVGQIPHVGDCELLEYYMDVTDAASGKWQTTKNRTWLVGMNAEDSVVNPFLGLQPYLPDVKMAPGSTECRNAWMGLTAGAMNPKFDADGILAKASAGGRMDISRFSFSGFSHFDDVLNVYGLGADGYPRSTWDNVGVQYGLQAMKDGKISPVEFLDLNLKIGGWKQPGEMVSEGFPYNGTGSAEQQKAATVAGYFDPWGMRNMNRWNPADPEKPAPRSRGDVDAIKAMYQSGLVFHGKTDIPTIDWHPYLEHRLDMHNAHQSFAVRKRIRAAMGSSDHQAIWFTQTPATKGNDFDQVPMALEVVDEWMGQIRANPGRSVAENRPARAVDSCFDTAGKPIASGASVWDGILDSKPKGACTTQFPMYGTSRIVAGAPIEGGIFKCALKSVDQAVSDGTYGSWTPNATQVQALKSIFPEGVCDYSKPDQGKP